MDRYCYWNYLKELNFLRMLFCFLLTQYFKIRFLISLTGGFTPISRAVGDLPVRTKIYIPKERGDILIAEDNGIEIGYLLMRGE